MGVASPFTDSGKDFLLIRAPSFRDDQLSLIEAMEASIAFPVKAFQCSASRPFRLVPEPLLQPQRLRSPQPPAPPHRSPVAPPGAATTAGSCQVTARQLGLAQQPGAARKRLASSRSMTAASAKPCRRHPDGLPSDWRGPHRKTAVARLADQTARTGASLQLAARLAGRTRHWCGLQAADSELIEPPIGPAVQTVRHRVR